MADALSDKPSWNPLRCGGTALPPTVLMAAKLTAVGLVALGYVGMIERPYMPLFGWPYGLPELATQRMLQGLMLAATALLVFNRAVRSCCAVIAGVVLLSFLLDRPAYTNAKLFAVVLLLFIALYDGRVTHTLLRWQMALMYFAAAINKLFEADWRSGVYFDYLLGEVHKVGPYLRVAEALPERGLGLTMSWMTIAIEFVLAALFLIPRAPRLWLAAVALGVAFHGMSMVMIGTLFGIYIPAVVLAYLLIFEPPGQGQATLSTDGRGLFARCIAWLDRDRMYAIERGTAPTAALRTGDTVLQGVSAKLAAIIWLPTTWLGITLLLVAVRQAKIWAIG